MGSLFTSAAGQLAGAIAAVFVLQHAEEYAGIQGLVPNPQLGDGVSNLTGMLVEGCIVVYTACLLAWFPNYLASVHVFVVHMSI